MPVYSCGSNGNGQLGVGHTEDIFSPQLCQIDFSEKLIVKIAAGGNHSVILLNDGSLYFCGDNTHGQCADVFSTHYQRSITLGNRVWKDVACGWAFTVLVEKLSGQVFVLGEGKRGELGHGDALSSTDVPVAVAGIENVESVACGWRHVLAVKSDHSVVGWGSGSHGQLGSPMTSKPILPNMIIPSGILAVACGQMHSVFLDTQNQIFTMGLNKHGQLGIGSPADCPKSSSPQLVQLQRPIKSISCGWHHTAALTQDNDIIAWGRNDHHQLANVDTVGDGWMDQPVKLSWKPVSLQNEINQVDAIACGSEHMLALCKETRAYAWGWNEHGNCAASDDDVHSPSVIDLSYPKLIAAGCGTSWIVTE
ncbi:alpha tubulin suppressor [Umbelopsis sp. WA50703]